MKLANKRKDKLRNQIRKLRTDKNLTLKDIANKVGLPDRQWVWYYINHD